MPHGAWRTAKKLVDGAWVEVEFKDLKKGDRFRLFETDGKPAHGHDFQGDGGYEAASDAVPCEPEGNYGIRVEEVKL